MSHFNPRALSPSKLAVAAGMIPAPVALAMERHQGTTRAHRPRALKPPIG